MNAPKRENLISQCFNSERIEFAWQFDREDGLKDQFILQIHKNPVIYMEAGTVDESGYYTDDPNTAKFGYGHLGPEMFLIHPANTGWSKKEVPAVYNNFTNGQDLVSLVEEVNEYLLKL